MKLHECDFSHTAEVMKIAHLLLLQYD